MTERINRMFYNVRCVHTFYNERLMGGKIEMVISRD